MNPYQYAQAVLAAATCQWAMAQAPAAATPPLPAAAGVAAPASDSQPAAAKAPASPTDENPVTEPRIIRGNDKVIAPAAPAAALSGSASAFNFEETPVADVVRIVLGDILKVDYVLHPPLAGTVTLATREAVSPDQALYLLESALQANGLVLVRDARGAYHVGRPDAVKGIGSNSRQVVSGGNLPAGFGVVIVPLQFIGANEMATILRPLMPAEALVRADTVRNLLVLVGTRSQADGWLDLVRTFDVDLLKGMSVGVFPLKYASVKEVEAALRLMSPGGAAATPPATGASTTTARPQTGATGAAAASSTAASLSESNPLHGALRIMPIERINSILVVTPRAAYLDEARLWIERLDKPGDNSSEPQLFVYPVQNGSAQHLAEVLNGIFGSGSSNTSGTSTGVAPRLGSSTGSSNQALGNIGAVGGLGNNSFFTSGGATVLGAPSNNSARSGTASGASSGTGAVALNQNVRVMADDRNNAVLIYGTRAEYGRIESALKRLDSPPTQVLIEASIVEVTLTDDLKYGVQWMFSDGIRNGLNGGGVISGATAVPNGVLTSGAGPGFSYTLTNPLKGVRAVLNALATKTKLNVIASPSLMVLDNHTANISSGTQQPINTGSTVVSGGTTIANIQYKDTGVSLAVTPSVNAGDMVTMDITQALTDVGAADENTKQVTFIQRQISSKAAVRSGETLVLGGLIQEKNTGRDDGVPGLQDIPLLGALFGTKQKNLNRTELLIVITPRVVRSDQNMREASQELRDRMRGLSSGFQEGRGLKLQEPSSPGRSGPTQEN
jgi:general secretion pathway protein D